MNLQVCKSQSAVSRRCCAKNRPTSIERREEEAVATGNRWIRTVRGVRCSSGFGGEGDDVSSFVDEPVRTQGWARRQAGDRGVLNGRDFDKIPVDRGCARSTGQVLI